MKRSLIAILLSLILSSILQLNAQVVSSEIHSSCTDNYNFIASNNFENANRQIDNKKVFKRRGKFGFFVVGGYAFGLDKYTSSTGKYVPNDSNLSTNDFFLQYARINGAFYITPKVKANLLFNLADFKKDNVAKKVLEIASITYQFNSMINLRVGEYRPYFGVENTYGFFKHLSNYWSNTYLLMGGSHWQSFQIGASIYGNLNNLKIPLKYYLNVYNGNGKNQYRDNDSNKNVSARIVLTAISGVEVGINYAVAKHLEEDVNAITCDFKTSHELTSKWILNSEFSFANGHNLKDAIKFEAESKALDDYKFRGWYFTPQLIHNFNQENLKSIALSCRYEGLLTNLDHKNLRTTITPMIDFNIDNDFRVSIVGVINTFENEDISIGKMNSEFMQLRLSFNY